MALRLKDATAPRIINMASLHSKMTTARLKDGASLTPTIRILIELIESRTLFYTSKVTIWSLS